MLQRAPVPARVVRPGDAYPEARPLLHLLTALGDLPGETPPPAAPSVYEGAVVDAVRRFQKRHGLDTDGIIGARTRTALRVPLVWRARQIELALERLRWLPHLNHDRFLAVNIPMFRLWVWDSMPPNGAPSFGMDVIVGRGLNRQTPVFVEEMEYLLFRPYWNVPTSTSTCMTRQTRNCSAGHDEISATAVSEFRIQSPSPSGRSRVKRSGIAIGFLRR